MNRIYLDHAATSFPKAPQVSERIKYYLDEVGANMGRSSYAPAAETLDTALNARESLCRLFGFSDPSLVVFTPGQTYSLNFVMKGLLRRGDHVVVSSLEHNAVMRPLTQLAKDGVRFSRVPCMEDGGFDLEAFCGLLLPETRLAVISHASNVSGALLPLEQIASCCRAHGVPLLIDAAQTGGHVPLSVQSFGEFALAVPAHKGLLGPQGIGALLLTPALAARLEPLVTGGTGSFSDSEEQPRCMPDRFESGTLNLPGLFGFQAALSFVEQQGVDSFFEEEKMLTDRFLTGLKRISGLRVLPAGAKRVGVISCCFTERDNAQVSYLLEKEYGILTRCGLHCAPAAHRSLGSFPEGSVRFSFGYGNGAADIDAALAAIEQIMKSHAPRVCQ